MAINKKKVVIGAILLLVALCILPFVIYGEMFWFGGAMIRYVDSGALPMAGFESMMVIGISFVEVLLILSAVIGIVLILGMRKRYYYDEA